MTGRWRYIAALLITCLAVFAPMVWVFVGPAEATLIDLTYTNAVGLPEGTTTYGTVNVTAGTSLVYTLDSFSFGGLTYTADGFTTECNDTSSTGKNCDGFGKFAKCYDNTGALETNCAASGGFTTPVTVLTTDTTGDYVGHAQYTASNGNTCTFWISNGAGPFAGGGTASNECAGLAGVPEPGTALLTLTGLPGLVGLVAMSRRRSRQPA